jgi:hypothetical protein
MLYIYIYTHTHTHARTHTHTHTNSVALSPQTNFNMYAFQSSVPFTVAFLCICQILADIYHLRNVTSKNIYMKTVHKILD